MKRGGKISVPSTSSLSFITVTSYRRVMVFIFVRNLKSPWPVFVVYVIFFFLK